MPSAMVDTTVATTLPPLDLTGRRHRRRSPALSTNANTTNNAAVGAAAVPVPKPKAKTVASRYLTERPCPPVPQVPNAVAVGASCGSGGAGAGDTTTTTRTLAVAFQSPTYSLETSTRSRFRSQSSAGPPATASEKKSQLRSPGNAATSARDKVSDATQNAYRWPSTSAPCGHAGRALATSASSHKAVRATPRRASVDGANEYLLAAMSSSDDTDSSASSGGGSGDGGGATTAPRRSVGAGPRPSLRSVMGSSARFASGTRSERFVAYPATPSRASASTSPAPAKKRSLFAGLLSSPFGRTSLNRQPPSPSKPVAGSFRGTAPCPSPARRCSTEPAGSAGNTLAKASSTGCGMDGDVKLPNKPSAAIKAEEEHQLRLLYTRELQWRLVNAQAGAALSSQTKTAERNLCGAWISVLRMRRSVAIRKMQLQLLHNNRRLMAILKGQMKYLEEWSFLERDHAHSLSGTAQALNATVVRLPVSNGALADFQGIKGALSSAVDVMHTMGKSTSTHLPKLAWTNVLVSQLSRVFIQEHILISQCRDLLSTLASMHVKYSSLQGQIIQLKQTRLCHFQ